MAPAMHTQHPGHLRGPVVHDHEELVNIVRFHQCIDDRGVGIVTCDKGVQAAVQTAWVIVEARGWDFRQRGQISRKRTHVDLHILERAAFGAAAAGTAGDRDACVGDVSFPGVVFAVPGEGCLAAVEEGARGEVVRPEWPVPVSDIAVSKTKQKNDQGVVLREIACISALLAQGSLPQPDELAMPWQEEAAVVSVQCIIDMCAGRLH